jgi:hypothetical protein
VAAQSTEEKQDAGVRQMLGMKGAAEETDLFKIRVQLTKPVTWVPLIWGALSGGCRGCTRGHAVARMRSRMLAAAPRAGTQEDRCAAACAPRSQSCVLAPEHRTHAPDVVDAPSNPPTGQPLSARKTPGVICGAAASGNYVWNDPTDVAQLLTCCMMSGPFLTGYTQTINDYYDREIDAINEPYRPIPSGGQLGRWRQEKNDDRHGGAGGRRWLEPAAQGGAPASPAAAPGA